MKAYTLFNLKSDKNPVEYRQWALTEVHPRMLKMSSVLAFRDYQVVGAMNGAQPQYEFVEEIEITTPEAFEGDHVGGDGEKLAKEWLTWVSDFTVIYCREIKELEHGPG